MVDGDPTSEKPRFLRAGDTALVVEFGSRIDRALSSRVLQMARRLEAAAIPGVVEALPTFRSLLVQYDPLKTSGSELEEVIGGLLSEPEEGSARSRLWHVPVCYEDALAPDLAEVAKGTGLSPAEVVSLHSTTPFHVYMLGFVPGFPYMGDLPEPLRLPRRVDPRVRVPPGSVAIATAMTAIYPLESPGGWHLIGTTPIPLMNETWDRPVLLSPGDAVRFEPVSRVEFDRIRAAAARDDYVVASEEIAA